MRKTKIPKKRYLKGRGQRGRENCFEDKMTEQHFLAMILPPSLQAEVREGINQSSLLWSPNSIQKGSLSSDGRWQKYYFLPITREKYGGVTFLASGRDFISSFFWPQFEINTDLSSIACSSKALKISSHCL